MFQPTSNPYRFKYLITGITGPGIEQVYLPIIPKKKNILFTKEKKFIHVKIPDDLKKAMREIQTYKNSKNSDPDWIHPLQGKLTEWEDDQWDKCVNGAFFCNGYDDKTKEPEIVYITGFHYWFLNFWKPYFGTPDFRDSDKEVFYWIKFWEEDPNSYGGTLNSIRRWAKSTIMGAWVMYRTTMNYNHNSGMQGETDGKIKKFYKKMVLKPFLKLPPFLQPKYNTDTKQTNEIEFDLPPPRKKQQNIVDADEKEVLESMLDYRASGEGEYDGDILNSYVMEEPGKIGSKVSLYDDDGEGRWDIVKPCFLQGDQICGKGFLGTTVENLKVTDRGGRQYKKLFYDSDYNQKQEDGRTISGLFAAFLPGDCALKGYYDLHGRPLRDKARESILITRKSYRKNATKLAGWIRKYPLSIMEIFYISPDRCEYNSVKLQDRLMELDMNRNPLTSKYDLYWENNVRFSKIRWRHNPEGGWCELSALPREEDQNKVRRTEINGQMQYSPLNDSKYASGFDPIQHGSSGSSRESRPVQYVKSKYDSSVDGQWDESELELKCQPGKMIDGRWVLDPNGKPYQYKSNLYYAQMDQRPTNPNVLFERNLMICWLFGVSMNVEKQFGGACINYFYANGCGNFILPKYKPEFERPDRIETDGTSANTSTIQEYTSDNATYIDYFIHMMCFREYIEDALIFDASDTREHDYNVAGGWTEMAAKIRPKMQPAKEHMSIAMILPMFDNEGIPMN